MTTWQIIANVLGFIGMGLIFITSFFRSKKLVLSVQSVAHVVMSAQDIIVGSYTSLLQEILCWIRDIGIISKKDGKVFKILVIATIVIAGVLINIFVDNCNVFGFLTVFSNMCFTVDVFYNNKKVVGFKLVSAFNCACWMALFINYQVYTSAIINGIACLLNLIVAIILFVKIKKGLMDKAGNKIITE